ncbi:MAG TPA: tetratricopeptide repeat protein [Pyrinomonadaceae bacterium]|nr:tetratricopeptide repeat protein [Pyrinomonadaceae bacterium]
MRAVTRYIAIALLALAPGSVCGQRDRDTYSANNQTFEVTGQVNVAGANTVARDLPVRLERFSGGVIDQVNTDARGRFRFANLQRGYYKIVINAPGFAPAQQDADLTLLVKAYLVFTLTRADKDGNRNGSAINEVIDARIPANARDEFARGRDALTRKSYAEAIAHFQKATSIYPDFFEAELLRGSAYMDLREWPKAETAIEHALAIKPDNAGALLALGEIYWRQKRTADAERALLDGLKLEENNWHGQFTLARLYWEAGDALKAGPHVGRTIQLKPDFAEAHLLAGNVLLKIGQPQRAEVEYEEYLRLAPKGEFAAEARTLIDKLHRLANEKHE